MAAQSGNNEKLLPIDVVETGLESDGTHKTGYALSKIIRLDELSNKLTELGKNPKDILQYNTDGKRLRWFWDWKRFMRHLSLQWMQHFMF